MLRNLRRHSVVLFNSAQSLSDLCFHVKESVTRADERFHLLMVQKRGYLNSCVGAERGIIHLALRLRTMTSHYFRARSAGETKWPGWCKELSVKVADLLSALNIKKEESALPSNKTKVPQTSSLVDLPLADSTSTLPLDAPSADSSKISSDKRKHRPRIAKSTTESDPEPRAAVASPPPKKAAVLNDLAQQAKPSAGSAVPKATSVQLVPLRAAGPSHPLRRQNACFFGGELGDIPTSRFDLDVRSLSPPPIPQTTNTMPLSLQDTQPIEVIDISCDTVHVPSDAEDETERAVITKCGWLPRKGAYAVLESGLKVFTNDLFVQDGKVMGKWALHGEEIEHAIDCIRPDELNMALDLLDPSASKREHPVLFAGDVGFFTKMFLTTHPLLHVFNTLDRGSGGLRPPHAISFFA